MNTKYLVIADTYQGGYGVEYTLFGIFDTEQEAVDFIINNPKIKMGEGMGYYGEEVDVIFDFFKYYEPAKAHNGTKEDYARKYLIKTFNGNPTYIGGYRE